MDEAAAPVPENFIVLEWGDGEYTFRLPIGQIAELQTKCGAGIGKIFSRLHAGRYQERSTRDVILNPLQAEFHHEDVREVIRLGLIGGGVTPTKAMQLVRDYVDSRPFLENWKVASAILSAFLIGYTDPDKVEEAEKKTAERPETTKAGST